MKKELRQRVYHKFNGKCAYCGCELEIKQMQVDHIIAKYKGGIDDIENYNPSCRSCNFRKGSMTIEEFRKDIEKTHERLYKSVFMYRLGLRYGLVLKGAEKVVFEFELIK